MPKMLIDKTPKKNPAIPDNFMIVPDILTSKQAQALLNLQKILKYKLAEKIQTSIEVADANPD